MYRLIGYFSGTLILLILTIKNINPQILYIVLTSLSLAVIALMVLFRLLAKFYNGFWKVWSKRFQTWVSNAFQGCAKYVQLPEYEVRAITVDQHGNRTYYKATKNRTIVWNVMQMIVCIFLPASSPLLLAFILFCFGEAIYNERQFQIEENVRYKEKQEIIERQSARMSLMQSRDSYSSRQKNQTSLSVPQGTKFPLIDDKIRKTAITVSQMYPNELIISHRQAERSSFTIGYRGVCSKKSERDSDNLSTNMTPGRQFTRDLKSHVIESVVEEKESQLQSDREESKKEVPQSYKIPQAIEQQAREDEQVKVGPKIDNDDNYEL